MSSYSKSLEYWKIAAGYTSQYYDKYNRRYIKIADVQYPSLSETTRKQYDYYKMIHTDHIMPYVSNTIIFDTEEEIP